MEETVSTCSDGLIAVDASRANHADRCGQFSILGVHVFHHSCLNARGVRTQQNILGHIIGMLADEESILHISGRMVSCKVHLRENVEIIFHFRAVSEYKARTREDIDNLVCDDGQWMSCSELNGVGCACQVDSLVSSFLRITLFT